MSVERSLDVGDVGDVGAVWASLVAATTGRTPFTLGYLGTVASGGQPRVRAVILRAVDERRGAVAFATDSRTAKVGELAKNARAALTFYDPERDVQLRLDGRAEIVTDSAVRREVWEKLGAGSKRLYDKPEVPGTLLAEGVSDGRGTGDEAAFERFAWVRVTVDAIDAVDLSGAEHIRCRHTRGVDSWVSERLVP